MVAELFLDLNGLDLTASDEACVTTLLRVAAGELAEDDLARWIEANSRPTG